jgi:predicted lipid carrier protein YhbT
MNSPSRLPVPFLPAVLAGPLELVRDVSRRWAPRVLRSAGSAIPFSIQREVLSRVMDTALQEPLADGDFEFLRGKWLKVDITDVGLYWYFSYDQDDRLIISQEQRADATIRGDLKEFLELTARTEDPDTLFFQRRLQIEGDTELGLEVKNLLDGVDQDGLPPLLRLLMLQGAALAATLL